MDKRTIWALGLAVAVLVATILLISVNDDQLVMGDPAGSTGENGASGSVQSDGGGASSLLAEGDEDGVDLWQVNVGDTGFSGLGAENVGDVLFRGELTMRTLVDEDGNKRSVEVCTNIPEIEASKDYRFNTPGSDSIGLLLDLSACTVSVKSVTYGVVDELGANKGGALPQPGAYTFDRFQYSDLLEGTYALYRDWLAEETLPHRGSNSVVDAKIRARVNALDPVAEVLDVALTETQLKMKYDASSMSILDYYLNCDTDSPAVVIRWHNLLCYHGPKRAYDDKVTGYVKGSYEAQGLTILISGDHRHQSSVSFSGYSDRYRATCWWSDDLDDLSFLTFSVKLVCDEE